MTMRTHARCRMVGQVEAEAVPQLVEAFATVTQSTAEVRECFTTEEELRIYEAATDVVMGVTGEERPTAARRAKEELPAFGVDITAAESEETFLWLLNRRWW